MTDTQELCLAIIGTNGTGKSTQIARIVAAHVKNGGRALIVTPDDIEWQKIPEINISDSKSAATFKGTRKTIFLESNKENGGTLEFIKNNYRNGMLVFDDCRAYLTPSVALDLHDVLIRRRQKHTNLVFVAHGFTELIPKIFTFATHYLLFLTLDNIRKRKDNIKDLPKMESAVLRINQKALNNHHYFEIIPA